MLDEFTKREFQVLELVARGCSNQEIMKRLCITRSTLSTHLGGIYSKIGIFYEDCGRETSTRRVQAALYYWQKYNNGLIDLTKERV